MFRKTRSRRVRYIRVILKARAWRKLPMKLLKLTKKMPRTKKYHLVPNDEYDPRIPLHSDRAFEYGIRFRAKYIGTMDVPRPSSRVEIVAAMRRVRYEFKARGIQKRQVTVDVSVEGVRVLAETSTTSQRMSFFSRKKTTTECIEIMHHPIYRIFYVSHDSSDLKIFSYIARDGATNIFKCNVFKSTKKSQAMKIVRTVGQAFEVCHEMQRNIPINPVPSTSSAPDEVYVDHASEVPALKEPASECGASEQGAASTSRTADEPRGAQNKPKIVELLPPPPKKEGKRSVQALKQVPSINLPDLPECVTKVELLCKLPEDDAATPLSAQHQLQLLREQLDQQAQQTGAAVAQLLLLRDQLAAEQAARCEAQARTHQLLVHNKELLEHIGALVAHLEEKEKGDSRPINAQQLTMLPQIKAEGNDAMKTENIACNGNFQPRNNEALINFNSQRNNNNQCVENNNINPSNFTTAGLNKPNGSSSSPIFENMTNDQIQNYLISKFQDMPFTNGTDNETNNNIENKYYYQNCNAFPHIPPLDNYFSNSDLASLLNQQGNGDKSSSSDEVGTLAQAMSIGQSQNSLYSTNSQASTSKDSSSDSSGSEDGVPYIMPLSHNGTLTATGDDGRVRLIVPVSPSPSTSGVGVSQPQDKQPIAGTTLKVPGMESLAPNAPITRSTSEKVSNRSELMTALRAQWARHTTK